jgi:hypothetical protein
MLKPFDRNRYFQGKLLMARDLEQEQTYFNSKRWLINRLLFGSGIACGLEVSVGGGTSPQLVVKPGVAIDVCGREVVIAAETEVKIADLKPAGPRDGTKSFRLCLEYEECKQEPIPAMKGSACEQVCDFNRVREGFSFKLHDAPPEQTPPTPCDRWMNRQSRSGTGPNMTVERVAPVWVRPGEVFEVAVKVTARSHGTDLVDVSLDERVSGSVAGDNPVLIEPQPNSAPARTQFPTVPLTLREGEFFVYVYQVVAPRAGTITIMGLQPALTPTLVTTIEVVNADEATRREGDQRLKACDEGQPGVEACVEIAEVRLTFEGGNVTVVDRINQAPVRRFKYTLERAAELLECVRASLLAEAGSPRPGHLFITFKDLQLDEPQPIKATGEAGDANKVSRANHSHRLIFENNSGLKFTTDNKLYIDGPVGGSQIEFLHTVKGIRPGAVADLATKGYVDENITSRLNGLDWQESVLTKTLSEPPTLSNRNEDKGKRYLLYNKPRRGVWAGPERDNNIAEWTGTRWSYAKPDKGTAVFVEDENIAYLFITSWQPFLATPDVTAGPGLEVVGPAVLGVKAGNGIVVNKDNNDKVAVDFDEGPPQPVGPVSRPGVSPKLAHFDHVHAVPLAGGGSSGLVFEGERLRVLTTDGSGLRTSDRGLRVEGEVTGTVSFHEAFGVEPRLDAHLTTKRWVDSFVRGYVDSTVSAMLERRLNELDWQESAISRNVTTPPALDESLGKRYLIAPNKPEELKEPWRSHPNQIAVGAARDWNYISADAEGGTAIFVEDEKKLYVFMGGVWSPFLAAPPPLLPGDGLGQSGNTLFVQTSEGVTITDDRVTLAFSSALPTPVGAANVGSSPLPAHSDHSHAFALPEYLNSATGTVAFNMTSNNQFEIQKMMIEPVLGPGLISVILGLELRNKRNEEIYIGSPELASELGIESVSLGAVVVPGKAATAAAPLVQTTFTIFARFTGANDSVRPPESIGVRWYAYRVGPERHISLPGPTPAPAT